MNTDGENVCCKWLPVLNCFFTIKFNGQGTAVFVKIAYIGDKSTPDVILKVTTMKKMGHFI